VRIHTIWGHLKNNLIKSRLLRPLISPRSLWCSSFSLPLNPLILSLPMFSRTQKKDFLSSFPFLSRFLRMLFIFFTPCEVLINYIFHGGTKLFYGFSFKNQMISCVGNIPMKEFFLFVKLDNTHKTFVL
jgi:hypothetical protein